jgi:hypothetical protein
VSDTIEILKQRISYRIKASDERCIASKESLRQGTDLVAMSRDAVARSREKVARPEFKTRRGGSSHLASSRPGHNRDTDGAEGL